MPDIGLSPPGRRSRSVCGTLNLLQSNRQVLGADLKRSESRWGAEMRLDARGGGGTDPCGVSGCERGRLGEALSNCPSPTKASTASPLHLTRAMQAGRFCHV